MEMEQDVKTLKDYAQIARRRKYYIVIPMLIFLALSVIVALILPPVYRSKATILIEQQHIPVDLVKSTVVSFADERIQQIQQKIMRIDNINKIITKFNLYSEEVGKNSPTELAEQFVENVFLEVISADVISQGKKSQATLAFDLAFDNKNPKLAQKVANELVTSFLSENARSRTERAKETSSFLNEESEKYKQKIQIIENKIAEYKDKYSESLPELLSVNLSSVTRVENELQQLQLREQMLVGQIANLRSQLAVTNPSIAASGENDQALPLDLAGLNAEYSRLVGKYSESHPDVKAIKRKISNFKKTDVGSEKNGNDIGNISNPVYLQLRNELNMSSVALSNINSRRAALNDSLRKLEINVSQTHQVERGYKELMRDLDGHKEKYRELTAKHMDAKLAQTLEEEQKAEKFSILEPPRVPDKPERPNRIKIIFIGFAISIFSGLGMGYIKEMMDDSIRGQKALISATGIEPLVVIPYIINDEDKEKTRKNKFYFLIIGSSIFVVMLLAIHFLYMNLDVIIYKLLHKLELLI